MYFITFYNNDRDVSTTSHNSKPDFDLVVKSIQQAETNRYLLVISDGEADLIFIDYRNQSWLLRFLTYE